MQSVWQATQRLKGQLETLPAWLGLLFAATLLGGVAMFVWHFQSNASSVRDGDYLLDGREFADSQLGPMVQAFSKSKLTAYVIDKRRIRVPRGQCPAYLASLAEGDALPRELQSHTSTALQQSKLFETGRDRQQRIRHAREQDLAAAIREMEGVEDAMVQVDEAEHRGFQTQRMVTASIAVMPAEGHVLDRSQIRAIRYMVAAANWGMVPDDVSITDLRAGMTYIKSSEDDDALPAAEEYISIKRAVELEWQQKVAKVLSYVPAAHVVVDVELVVETALDEPMPLVLSEPKRLAISIAIPESYLVSIWRQGARSGARTRPSNRPTPSQLGLLRDETAMQIRDAVLGLIPEHIDTTSAVTVTTFKDLTEASVSWSTSWPPWIGTLAQHKSAWITVVLVGVLVGVTTRFWRRRPAENEPAGTLPFPSLRQGRDETSVESYQPDNESDLDEGALRATLTDLVRENPDGAAEILHRWIDKAG